MALSLLQHLHDTQASALKQTVQEMGLTAAQANSLLDWTVPLVLAHLVDLQQRHGTGLVLALINTRPVDGLWQTLDQAEWIGELQQHLPADALLLKVASQQVVSVVLAEIFELVDAASLGEDGLRELLAGQPEHLQGQAPDWVWQQSGLTSLCGQSAVVVDQSASLDLAAGIATLTQLVRQAAKQSQQPISEPTMSHPEPQNHLHQHDTQTAGHAAAHPAITLPSQRAAGRLTRGLEPVIALAILWVLYVLFVQSSAQLTPVPAALTAKLIAAPTEETVLIPTIVADDSQLPPLDSAQPNIAEPESDMTEAERAIAEAQRTGEVALQFNDNEL